MDAVLEKTASMGDIAVENGFAGASYFSETFRKEMGCSPADYRKWYRDLSDECPIITGENKEESAKVSKKDKKESLVKTFLLIYYRKLAALIFLRNSGKPPFIKIIQRSQSFPKATAITTHRIPLVSLILLEKMGKNMHGWRGRPPI